MIERHFVLAITGASGCVYGLRLGEELLAAGVRLSLLISRPGFSVLKEECGLDWDGDLPHVCSCLSDYFNPAPGQLLYYPEDDFFSPLASGSSAPDTMIVAPCSMGSLARIAAGLSGNLLERTADVMIKEGRPLVLVPRETPLSAIHLENMLKLARLGVRIVPAMPAFYVKPQTIRELTDFVVGKVLDQTGIPHRLYKPWGAEREG
jgi:4-hydroxy-3-polyprenylbenzoate decarboxylase